MSHTRDSTRTTPRVREGKRQRTSTTMVAAKRHDTAAQHPNNSLAGLETPVDGAEVARVFHKRVVIREHRRVHRSSERHALRRRG